MFKQAIQDMNSNLMPERAHALITLKKLIYAKNSNIQTNKAQLITVLTVMLRFFVFYDFSRRQPRAEERPENWTKFQNLLSISNFL